MINKARYKKALNVDLPADLYDMYAKMCIDLNISKTEGIVQYFKYLQKQNYRQRRTLNETTESDFTLDDRDP